MGLLQWLHPMLIESWVGRRTYSRGRELLQQGRVSIREASPADAICRVEDASGEIYVVELIDNNMHLEFSCSCSLAHRGYFCAHAVAAGLAVHQHLTHLRKISWRWRMAELKNSSAALAKKKPTHAARPYWFFVGLTHIPWLETYTLEPRRLWLDKLPPDILPEGQRPTMKLVVDLAKHNPWMYDYIKPFSRSLDLRGCVNLPEKAAPLARLLRHSRPPSSSPYYAYSDSRTQYALGDLLDLVVEQNIPLAALDEDGRFDAALTPLLDVRPSIALDKTETGARLAVSWEGRTLEGQRVPLEMAPHYTFLTETPPLWILSDTLLLRMDDAYAHARVLTDFAGLQGSVQIPRNELADFSEEFTEILEMGIPIQSESLERSRVVEQPVPRLYLTEDGRLLLAKLHFAYGQYVFPYDASLPAQSMQLDMDAGTLKTVVRQVEWEEATYKKVRSARYGLKRSNKAYPDNVLLLRARVDAVDFLLKKVPLLTQDGFEIYGEENLRVVRVNRHRPTISLNVSSGIDWFDLQAAVKFGETEADWKEVRRAVRKKERYIKLADGTIGEIPETWVKRYRHLFGLAETTDEGLRMRKEQVVLLDQLLGELDAFQGDEEFQRQRERLRDFSGIREVPLPQGFAGKLRPYQKAGYNWLHFLHEYGFGGCLADDMGLGKTVQVLAFLLALREEKHAQAADLIVVPRSLVINWQREAERFTPSLKVLLHFGQTRSKDVSLFEDYDLVITTYGTMLRDVLVLREYRFHYIVLDESQAIKNPLAKTSRAARKLNSDHRLVMTGTPVENTTFELWSQFAFLNPGLLGSLEYFKQEFGNPIEKKGDEGAAEFLRKMVYPFILRRTKDQVAPELPPRTERIIYCDMDPAQKKFYLRTRDYYRAQLLGLLENEGMDNARMKILEGLLRLRQICNHPKLVRKNFRGTSAKMDTLLEMMETLHSEGHRALVFSQFVKMLTLLRRELDRRGIVYEYLDGSTTNRQQRVDRFQQEASVPFFLISLKAGGVGLNLTGADYVLHVDPWWNPAVEMQATDRTHRIGQERPVFVYKFITRDSVEEKILRLQERKKALVQQLIGAEGSFFKNLTPEDVAILFGE